MITLDGIHKSYGEGSGRVAVLQDVSLRVQAGEVCAIMGASGSGKSTLLNILGLLDRPSSGLYRLDGVDVQAASSNALADLRNLKIGFVFQSFHLLPRLSALDNVAHPLLYRGLAKGPRRDLAAQALARVGLDHRLDHKPSELSGGQRQRVAIARALVGQPSLLLADEPTGNLDSQSAEEVMALLEAMNQSLGVTMVVVTHDQAIADRCHRAVVMRDGQVVS